MKLHTCGMRVLTAIFTAALGTAGAQSVSTLHSFTGIQDGAYPNGNLIEDSSGNFYGTSLNGGNSSNNGTVFKLSPPTTVGGVWTSTVLYAFSGGSDGGQPAAGLLVGLDQGLYGTAENSNGEPYGVVFRISQGASGPSYSVIYSFSGGADGGNPNCALITDSAGGLYGTTTLGGANNQGTVFKLTPIGGGSYSENVLYSFTGGTDGGQPYAGLTVDSIGGLYGTATFGGTNNSGTVFKLAPSTNSPAVYTFTTLYNFTGGADGSEPYGGLFLNSTKGVLFGTTFFGGANGYGTVYNLSKPLSPDSPFNFDVIHAFTADEGGNSSAALRYNPVNSTLYGTAFDIDANGSVFDITPLNSAGLYKLNIVHTFTGGTEGTNPLDSVTFDQSGRIYGTTYLGGASGLGTAFVITSAAQ